jgi:hypothetical protein
MVPAAEGETPVTLGRPKVNSIAAWLGICALILNALVPIHLAFDLADALNNEHPDHVGHVGQHHHGSRHGVLAALVGHRHTDGKSEGQGHGHHIDCAVCGTLGALGGFAPASAIIVPVPTLFDALPVLEATPGEIRRISHATYCSRAPPEG